MVSRRYRGKVRGGKIVGKFFIFHGRQNGVPGLHKVLVKNTQKV